MKNIFFSDYQTSVQIIKPYAIDFLPASFWRGNTWDYVPELPFRGHLIYEYEQSWAEAVALDFDFEQVCGSGEPGAMPRITQLRTRWRWQNWNGQMMDSLLQESFKFVENIYIKTLWKNSGYNSASVCDLYKNTFQFSFFRDKRVQWFLFIFFFFVINEYFKSVWYILRPVEVQFTNSKSYVRYRHRKFLHVDFLQCVNNVSSKFFEWSCLRNSIHVFNTAFSK